MKKYLGTMLSLVFLVTSVLNVSEVSGLKGDLDSYALQVPLILKQGSRGGDVYDLQGRLKFLGFYTGPITGYFGERTYKAVRLFQYEFGLPKIDGIVGIKTLDKLKKATKKYSYTSQRETVSKVPKTSNGLSQQELKLLAKAVYSEARGEPYMGQVAVAAVILNRLQSQQFPKTISGIVFQPLAFTAVADGQIWMDPNETAKKAVLDAVNGWDPTSGAIYYFNPKTATSKWIWSRPQIKKIGNHIFCR